MGSAHRQVLAHVASATMLQKDHEIGGVEPPDPPKKKQSQWPHKQGKGEGEGYLWVKSQTAQGKATGFTCKLPAFVSVGLRQDFVHTGMGVLILSYVPQFLSHFRVV